MVVARRRSRCGSLRDGHFLAGQDQRTGIRLEDACDQVQKRGFAGAALASQHDLRLFREAEALHIDDGVLRAVGRNECLFQL